MEWGLATASVNPFTLERVIVSGNDNFVELGRFTGIIGSFFLFPSLFLMCYLVVVLFICLYLTTSKFLEKLIFCVIGNNIDFLDLLSFWCLECFKTWLCCWNCLSYHFLSLHVLLAFRFGCLLMDFNSLVK